MQSRTFPRLILISLLAAALPVFGQSGLRVPQRGEPGIDPGFARGWLAPDYDRFGFARQEWKHMVGFAPTQRMNWAYAFGDRASLGLSYSNARDLDSVIDGRQFGVFGRYSFSSNWSLSAEALAREPGTVLRLNDFRIGVQRYF
jgi:hypothetical protein